MDTISLYYKNILKKFNQISCDEYFNIKNVFVEIYPKEVEKIFKKMNGYNNSKNKHIISFVLHNNYFLYIKKLEDDYYLIDMNNFILNYKLDQLSELLNFLNTIKNNPYKNEKL